MVWGSYSDSEPYTRRSFQQIQGGLDFFIGLLLKDLDSPFYEEDEGPLFEHQAKTTIVFEQFTLRPNGFTPSSRALEPLRIEGALRYYNDFSTLVMQAPSAQLLAGGDTPTERKRNSDNVLKRAGLWVTGKDVGQKDADDVISAQKHALHYMIHTLKHEPTIERYLS